MSLAPLLAAAPAVQAHVAAALIALTSVAGVAFLAKGTPAHVWLGRCFAVAMLATAITSFWITSLLPGRYSPIHILSVVTLVTLPLALLAVRRGDRRRHAWGMSMNAMGLLVAGVFTLMPARLMHAVLFGP